MENRLLSAITERNHLRSSWKANYVVGVIVKEIEKTLYVLCFKRRQEGSKEWILRLPGSKQKSGESQTTALKRACAEKIGCTFLSEQWKEGVTTFHSAIEGKYPQTVYITDVSDVKDFSFRTEKKFLTQWYRRKEHTEELAPPEWVPLCTALETLFYSHRALLLQSLPIIQKLKPSYENLLSFDHPHVVRHDTGVSFLKRFMLLFGGSVQPCCRG